MANTPGIASNIGFGLDSSTVPTTEARWGDIYSPGSLSKNAQAVVLNVNASLTERRIYCYLGVKMSAAAWYRLDAVVECRRKGRLVAELPACLMPDLAGNTDGSVTVSLFANGGTAVGDVMTALLPNAFDNTAQGGGKNYSVNMQPMRINGEFDTITLNIKNAAGAITGFRAVLGCISCLI